MARLIVVSDRVAIPSRDGANYAGGLAVAVRSLLRRNTGLWFGWSGTVSQNEGIRTVHQGGLSYVVSDLTAADYHEYHNGFANRVPFGGRLAGSIPALPSVRVLCSQ